jgi:hypothetical protein
MLTSLLLPEVAPVVASRFLTTAAAAAVQVDTGHPQELLEEELRLNLLYRL